MRKSIVILMVILILTGCTPTPEQTPTATLEPTATESPTATIEPSQTPTKEPKLEEVYSDFIETYNHIFMLLLEKSDDKEALSPLDLYFDRNGDTILLTANISVDSSLYNSPTPFAYPFTIVRKLVIDKKVDIPENIDYFVINLYNESGYKYSRHVAKWSDYLDYVNDTITFEQLFARMEHD